MHCRRQALLCAALALVCSLAQPVLVASIPLSNTQSSHDRSNSAIKTGTASLLIGQKVVSAIGASGAGTSSEHPAEFCLGHIFDGLRQNLAVGCSRRHVRKTSTSMYSVAGELCTETAISDHPWQAKRLNKHA